MAIILNAYSLSKDERGLYDIYGNFRKALPQVKYLHI
jgi:hypothetical protein